MPLLRNSPDHPKSAWKHFTDVLASNPLSVSSRTINCFPLYAALASDLIGRINVSSHLGLIVSVQRPGNEEDFD